MHLLHYALATARQSRLLFIFPRTVHPVRGRSEYPDQPANPVHQAVNSNGIYMDTWFYQTIHTSRIH